MSRPGSTSGAPLFIVVVASGILPDVEGRRLAARMEPLPAGGLGTTAALWPPGGTPRLHGRPEARRYRHRVQMHPRVGV